MLLSVVWALASCARVPSAEDRSASEQLCAGADLRVEPGPVLLLSDGPSVTHSSARFTLRTASTCSLEGGVGVTWEDRGGWTDLGTAGATSALRSDEAYRIELEWSTPCHRIPATRFVYRDRSWIEPATGEGDLCDTATVSDVTAVSHSLPVEWTRYEPTPDDRVLRVLYPDTCRVPSPSVRETDEAVTIELLSDEPLGAHGCVMIRANHLSSVLVTLEEPLGSREVRHG
jgi:hypothetical protein